MAEPVGYLLGAGNRPIPLVPGAVISIGRAPDNTAVFDDILVSRHHATIECGANGEVTIRDLGSSNGTFVNGERVADRKVVRGNDLIRLGGRMITFITAEDGIKPKAMQKRQRRKLTEHDTAVGISPTKQTAPVEDASLSGNLHDQPLPQILQYLSSNSSTGELAVLSRGGRGLIAFNRGSIYYAEYSDHKGELAIYLLAEEHAGTFMFRDRKEPPLLAPNVFEPVVKVIFECCRRMDETRAGKGDA
ncbi:MAG: FHA domain-containing protein [Planctomycetota bacterium]|nr:FHA domain-containing protein [Planctomycetota bacterium]